MSVLVRLQCNQCDYHLFTTGKSGLGMEYSSEPYKCDDCNIITDVTVGVFGNAFRKEDFTESKIHELPDFVIAEKEKFFCCEKCKGENLSQWDADLSPCPKCDGSMILDNNHPIADVD